MSDPLRIEKLRADHAVDGFDCGSEELNCFLVRFTLTNQQAGAAQTYVALSGALVVGYYSLAVGEVAYVGAPDRLSKGLARHPIPVPLFDSRLLQSHVSGVTCPATMRELKNSTSLAREDELTFTPISMFS